MLYRQQSWTTVLDNRPRFSSSLRCYDISNFNPLISTITEILVGDIDITCRKTRPASNPLISYNILRDCEASCYDNPSLGIADGMVYRTGIGMPVLKMTVSARGMGLVAG